MRRRAFGIAETLIASSVISMVIMGLYAISTAAARSAQTQSDRVTATALAEEVVDIMRYDRERYWRGIVGGAAPGRSADGFWTYLGSTPGAVETGSTITWSDLSSSYWGLSSVTDFKATAIVSKSPAAMQGVLSYTDAASGASTVMSSAQATDAAASLLKVSVTVSWAGAGGAESYVLNTYLSDWLEGML